MKKSKKNTPRPRWHCRKCGMLWVNHDPVCIICKIPGTPLNEGAEKVLNKRGGTT
jgi:rubrerythrin